MGKNDILNAAKSPKSRILEAANPPKLQEVLPPDTQSFAEKIIEGAKHGVVESLKNSPLGIGPRLIQGFQTADKLNNAKNAAVNSTIQQARTGKGSVDLQRAYGEGRQAFDTGEQVPLRAARQFTNERSGVIPRTLAKITDVAIEGATDPVNLITGPLAEGIGTLGRGGLRMAAESPVAQALAKKFLKLVNPITEAYAGSRIKAGIDLTLHAFGYGPLRGMQREVIKPYETALDNIGTQFGQVIQRAQRYTNSLRGPFWKPTKLRPVIDDWAQQHNGADPTLELLRRRIRDLGGVKPGQAWDAIQHDAQVLGIDPKFVDKAAQEIYSTYQAAEYTIAKFSPTRVSPATAENRIRSFTNQLFGKEPLSVKPLAAGKLAKPTTQAAIIHEAGLREYMSVLPNSRWVRPMTGATPTPGWRLIQSRGPLAPLAGMEVPAPLYSFLETELASSRLARSGEMKSWYIKMFDILMAVEKKGLGNIKRGWLGLPATQLANGLSNSFVSKLALDVNKASDAEFFGRLPAAYAKVMQWRKTGLKVESIDRMNSFSNALHATDVATNVAGANDPMTTLGKALPHNWGTQFQGVTEQAFKLALFETLEKKLGPKAAAAQVDKYMFDYSDRGVVLEIFDRFGIWPFSTFGVKATELLFDTILHHPEMLAKLPRLRYLATREDNPSNNPNLPEWMRNSQFTVGIGNNEYVNLGRFHPFGGPVDMLANAIKGVDLPTEIKNAADKTMFTPAYNIAQGRKTYTRDDRSNPNLLAKGEPPTHKLRLMGKEAIKAYAPGGRMAISASEQRRGVTPSDYKFQTPRSAEDVVAQFGLGIRATKAESDKERRGRIGGTAKARRTEEVRNFVKTERAKAAANLDNPMQRSAEKLQTQADVRQELKAANYRLATLQQSGQTVNDKGQLTKEGKDQLRDQILYIHALRTQLKKARHR